MPRLRPALWPARLSLLVAGLAQLPAGMNQLPAGMNQLPAGMNQLPAGMNQLPAGLKRSQAGSFAHNGNLPVALQAADRDRRPVPLKPLPAALQLLRAGSNLLISPAAAAVDGPASAQHSSPARPGSGSGLCSPASASRPIPLPQGPLLQPAAIPAAAAPPHGDYRQNLSTTPLGWPRLAHWCVWLEPVSASEPAALWEQRWWQASDQALRRWQALLPIERVDDPAAAQIRILRRRPSRQPGPDGRLRASHGRASLQLLDVNRAGLNRTEPSVEVLISPAQRPLAIEATALHELGHALGLWGHSDRAEDAMAAVPGAAPVLELSPRDRATLRWLYSQPTRFGTPERAGQTAAAGEPAAESARLQPGVSGP